MTKTETQIAEENIVESLNTLNPKRVRFLFEVRMKEHKASCERFLDFLNYCINELTIPENILKVFEVQITDLKQAIKLYEDNGI